jgi:protein-S-isoprenylcysteine O-methyltransferase Ste14
MPGKGLNAFLVFAVTLVAVSVAALFLWPWGLLLCLMSVVALIAEVLILKFTRPEILKRKIPSENWWDRILPPLIALSAIAAAGLSIYDVLSANVSRLPAWTFLPGLVLLMSCYIILTQALRAHAPHGEEKYGEKEPEDKERGPYDVIRHPVMLAVILGGISIPLFIGSGIGFIPVGVLIVSVIARVAAEDDWRFNNYEWFYDYTKEVSYRLIPFIW